MLAGICALPNEIEMGVGWGEQQNGSDRGIIEDPLDAVGDRKAGLCGESLAAGCARSEGRGHLYAILEIVEAFRMRRHRHAEADDAEFDPAHWGCLSKEARVRMMPRNSASPL